MEWIDGNIGSKVTMKYPAVWLTGEHAKGEVLSVAFAGEDSIRTPVPRWCTWPRTPRATSCQVGGARRWPGLLPWSDQINSGAYGSRSTVKCDALLVDTISRSDTYRMSTSARTTSRWATRPRCPRSATISCSI